MLTQFLSARNTSGKIQAPVPGSMHPRWLPAHRKGCVASALVQTLLSCLLSIVFSTCFHLEFPSRILPIHPSGLMVGMVPFPGSAPGVQGSPGHTPCGLDQDLPSAHTLTLSRTPQPRPEPGSLPPSCVWNRCSKELQTGPPELCPHAPRSWGHGSLQASRHNQI